MTERDIIEAELRGTCGEAVGTLRLISESTGHLTKRNVETLLGQALHVLQRAAELAARLP